MNNQLLAYKALTAMLIKITVSVVLLIVMWAVQSANSWVLAAKANPSKSQQITRGKVVADKFCIFNIIVDRIKSR